ncbi:MAG: HNH endonuclease [Verrucomicrobiota bacterium]
MPFGTDTFRPSLGAVYAAKLTLSAYAFEWAQAPATFFYFNPQQIVHHDEVKFGPLQLHYFNADDGAYSIVTKDERKKGQITLTEADGEAQIPIIALGEAGIPRSAAKEFPLDISVRKPDGTETLGKLTVNFPKGSKNELRIYRKAAAGFGFEADDVWFIYRRGETLCVGAMSEMAWRAIGRIDADDENYVTLASEEQIKNPRKTLALNYPRNPLIARKRFEFSGYKCEFDPRHKLFTARSTEQYFLEPHHLVPVSLQSRYKSPLDHIDNVFALCPWCHRAVHHATGDLVAEIVTKLVSLRSDVCKRLHIKDLDVLRLYNCERIE